MTALKVKLREIGTSLGVIIPKDIIRERSLKKNMEIEIFIPLKKNIFLLEETFGSVKKIKWKFKRDRIDRLERLGY